MRKGGHQGRNAKGLHWEPISKKKGSTSPKIIGGKEAR